MGEPIGRVVVIEDEQPVRDAVLAALSAERFRATGFADLPRPADVLALAPDLAILDVLLPTGDGFGGTVAAPAAGAGDHFSHCA
jgi:DNA-binding response OmpR family regulator